MCPQGDIDFTESKEFMPKKEALLSRVSIMSSVAVTGHHDDGNAYKGKHSIAASLTVSEAWSTIIMTRTMVANMALEK